MASNSCLWLHAIVCRLVEKYGEGQWATISQQLNKSFGKPDEQGRIGKQCREVRAAHTWGCYRPTRSPNFRLWRLSLVQPVPRLLLHLVLHHNADSYHVCGVAAQQTNQHPASEAPHCLHAPLQRADMWPVISLCSIVHRFGHRKRQEDCHMQQFRLQRIHQCCGAPHSNQSVY